MTTPSTDPSAAMSLADQVAYWRQEAERWQQSAQQLCQTIDAYQRFVDDCRPCTVFELVSNIALARLGKKIAESDLDSALDFLAASGFLTIDQYEVFKSPQTRYIPAVLDTWRIRLLATKAVSLCQGEALAISQQDYSLLGLVSTYAVAHSDYEVKCREADQWRDAFQALAKAL